MNKHLLLLCCFSVFNFSALKAWHEVGADISYEHLSGNQYLVKVRYFRDCAGILAPATLEICYHSVSCNYNDSAQLMMTGPPVELPPSPYFPPVVSTCQGGPGFGIERYIYAGVITLPFACNDWILSFTASIIYDSGNFYGNFIVTTKIDNLNYPDNSSARFIPDPLFQFCVAQLGYENAQATDIDGDSISYALEPTLSDSFFCPPQPVIPLMGTTYLFLPLSQPPFYIHPVDGWFNFTPTMVQIGYVTVRADEFRNGQLINQTLLTHMVGVGGGCLFSGLPLNEPLDTIIYPNPVQNVLNISLNGLQMVTMENTIGQRINFEIPGEISGVYQLDIGDFPAGVYFVSVKTSTGSFTKRIVKIN